MAPIMTKAAGSSSLLSHVAVHALPLQALLETKKGPATGVGKRGISGGTAPGRLAQPPGVLQQASVKWPKSRLSPQHLKSVVPPTEGLVFTLQ